MISCCWESKQNTFYQITSNCLIQSPWCTARFAEKWGKWKWMTTTKRTSNCLTEGFWCTCRELGEIKMNAPPTHPPTINNCLIKGLRCTSSSVCREVGKMKMYAKKTDTRRAEQNSCQQAKPAEITLFSPTKTENLSWLSLLSWDSENLRVKGKPKGRCTPLMFHYRI